MTELEQVCANPHCPHTFTPTRLWHRFCGRECRYQDYIRRKVEEFSTTHYSEPRRPSRDGSGVRVYVTAADFDSTGRPHMGLLMKMNRARDQLKRREETP